MFVVQIAVYNYDMYVKVAYDNLIINENMMTIVTSKEIIRDHTIPRYSDRVSNIKP